MRESNGIIVPYSLHRSSKLSFLLVHFFLGILSPLRSLHLMGRVTEPQLRLPALQLRPSALGQVGRKCRNLRKKCYFIFALFPSGIFLNGAQVTEEYHEI